MQARQSPRNEPDEIKNQVKQSNLNTTSKTEYANISSSKAEYSNMSSGKAKYAKISSS